MRTEDTSINRLTSVLLSALLVTSLAVLLLTFSSSSTTVSASSSLGWWDTNWQYRRLITITNTGNVLENYQVKIDIVNYDNGMLPNFDDLRFVDNDNVTVLSYWIENCNLDENAIVWVKIPSLPASGSKMIYMYYGNPSASSASNGNTTFMFFDDFNGATLDNSKWTVYKEGSTDAIVRIENGALHLAGKPNTVASGSVESVPSFTNNIAIRIKRELPNGVNYMDVSLGSGTIRSEDGGSSNWWNTTLGSGYLWETQSDTDARTYIMPATGEDIQIGTKWAPGTGAIQNYHTNEFVVSDEASSNIKWLEPGGLVYPTNPLQLPNYGASGLLHPDVLYFANGMDGYKYWMVYTPYPPDPKELETIVRSNDGVNWTSAGISNPVVPLGQTGDWNDQNNADPDFIYVENYHEWFMVHAGGHGGYYRVGLEYSNDGKTWYDAQQTTFNGKNAPIIIDNGNAQQPTLLYENGIFHVFYSSELYGNNRSPLCHATFNWNDTLKKAENITEDPNNPLVLFPADNTFESGAGHWDISKKDNTYYLYHVRYLAGSSAEGLALATSTNYENWPTTSVLVLAPSSGGWDSSQIYRSVPVVDNSGEIVLFDNEVKLYYSAYGSPGIGMAHGDGTQFTKGVIPSPIALEEVVDDIATDSTWLTNNKNILISQGSYTSSGSYGDQYVDWVLVRKYVSTEPTWIMGGKETMSVSVLISPSSQNGLNGSTLNYTVTVTNTENVSDNFNLTVSDNCNWAPTVSQASLVVAPSSSDNTTTLSVTIPENAIGGTINNITVTATSQTDNTVSASASCTAQVIARNVSVSISPSGNSGANGTTLTYTVTINNTGNVSDNYTLSATDNFGWSSSLSKPSIVVAPGSSDNTTTLSVTIPSGSVAGTIDHITVTATSQTDNTVSASASCTTQAVASYWLYMKKIVIDHNKVSENLTNFPILIDITDNDLKSHAQSNGYDIVFRDNFLTKLNHQIELYDNTTGHLVAWVNVPALSSTDNTILFMYYGNPTCGDQENVGGTWDDNFVLIQHLNEKSGTHYDSTSNYNNGTPNGGVAQGIVGKIDGADAFDGSSGYVDCGNGSSLNLSSKITVEGWVYLNQMNKWQTLVAKGSSKGWVVSADQSSKNEYDFCDMSVADYNSSGAHITNNRWIFITITFDNSLPSANIKFYENGLIISSLGRTSPLAVTSDNLTIARDKDGEYINGIVDEFRISKAVRSAGWISTEYNNENSPSTFYSVGSEETTVAEYQVKFDQTGLDNTATGTIITVNGLSLTRDNLPYIISVDNGTVENYSYLGTVSSTTIGKQFSENCVTGKPSPITVNGPENVTVNYVTQYKLTMAANVGATSPSVGDTWENAGSVVNISATPPSAGAGENYLFSGWIGTGTDNYTGPNQFASLTMNGLITETASWTHRYYLTVTSPHGTTGGEGWYDNGATANATVTPLTISGPAGVQYVFTNWSGDATGTTSPSNDIVMDGPKTAIAVWKTQYYLTVTSAHDTPGGQAWYDNGSTANATLTSGTESGGAGTQYVFTNWSGDASGTGLTSNDITMDGPKTATAVWKTQYYLTLTTSPSVGATLIGQDWYDSGASAAISTDNIMAIDSGSRYRFDGWTTDNMSEIADASSTSTTVKMDSSKTVTANYMMQYLVTFRQTGLDSTAVGTVVTVNGLPLARDNLPYSIWVDNAGSVTYGYSSIVSSTVDNKQFKLSSVTGKSSPITITGSENVTGNYVTQYKLTMATNFGTTSPSVGDTWENAGTVLTISATAPSAGAGENYLFSGWIGTGTDNYTGPNQFASLTMNGPITETASWTHRYYLTVNSPHGTTGGDGWYDNGENAYATVTPLTVAGSTGVQYVFTNWNGDATGTTSPSNPITMNAPKTATAVWKTQYYLTVTSAHDTPGGQAWYDDGSTANATLASGTESGGAGTQYVFTTWSGDASGTGLTSNDITMDAPKTATAVWKTQYKVTFAQSGLDSTATGTVVTVAGAPKTYLDLPFATDWLDNGSSLVFAYSDNVSSSVIGQQFVRVSVSSTSPLIVTAPTTVTGTYVIQAISPCTGTASIRLAISGTPPFVNGIYKATVTANLTVLQGDDLHLIFLAEDNKTVESDTMIWSRTAPGTQTVTLENLIVPHDDTTYIKRVKLVLTFSAGNVIVDNMAWYMVVQDDWGDRITWIVLNWAKHTGSQQDQLGDEFNRIVLNWAKIPTGPRDQRDFSQS